MSGTDADGSRASRLATGADLSAVVATLAAYRDEVLSRWVAAVATQPWHQQRPASAVADHIPALIDALLSLLRSGARPDQMVRPPLQDPAVLAAASSHADQRFQQGLTAREIVSEFRILRQEVWRALRAHLDPATPTADVLAAELLINDGLDAAISTALSSLTALEHSHQRLAHELAERRAELAAIVDSSEDAIEGLSLDGILTSWNRAAERLYGYTAGEMLGQPVAILIPPDRQDELTAILQRVRLGQPIPPTETLRQRKDGQLLYVSVSVSPVRDAHDTITGAAIIARDITQQRLLERERETFAAAVTHDLKNRLAAIRGTVQLLQRQATQGSVPPEVLLRRLDALAGASLQLTTQLEELEDAIGLRSGQGLQLRLQPLDLVALVQDVVGRYQAAETDHVVQLDTTAPSLLGSWDRTRLERVVDNLLSNAVKFSPEGGTISAWLGQEQGQGVLRVQDQGVGIPAADLPRIFSWFHRGSNVAGRIAGSGIGLAAARRIVEQHGGELTVDSQEGIGSTFTLRLPLRATDGP